METGLHYNLNRYYDPSTGRYITSDPIGIDGGLNLYLYAEANPVGNIDPLGLVCRKTARRGIRCTPDKPGPVNDCVIKCFAKRELVCAPFRAGGIGLGLTGAGIASIPSGGAAFPALQNGAIFLGSQTGRLACEAVMFDESCFKECEDKDCGSP